MSQIYEILYSSEAQINQQEAAVDILNDEWGFQTNRLLKMQNTNKNKCMLLLHNKNVVGYGELDASVYYSTASTNQNRDYYTTVGSCNYDEIEKGILTSFIIHKHHRRKGLGKIFLGLIEQEAISRRYFYLYLWANDAVTFYEKCGYHKCESINMNRDVFITVDREAISVLEKVLLKKIDPHRANTCNINIWMRKRLIMDHCMKVSNMDWDEFKMFCSYRTNTLPPVHGKDGWDIVKLLKVSWLRQIGPSCGLTAITIVLDYFNVPMKPQILLKTAIELGYSNDGEMFDMNQMKYLIEKSTSSNSNLIINLHRNYTLDCLFDIVVRNGIVIFPYDSDEVGFSPIMRGGLKAHYAIFIGVMSISGQDLNENHGHNFENIQLIAITGRSPQPVVAPITTWKNSNDQLTFVDWKQNEIFKGCCINQDTGPNLQSQFISIELIKSP